MPVSRTKPFLLLGVCSLLLVAGLGLWRLGGGRQALPEPLPRPERGPQIEAPAPGPLLEGREPELDPFPEVEPPSGTSVIWPLELQLTQVARSSFGAADGSTSPGEGANASLQGHVWGADDAGVRATLTFVHGSNKGRVLGCDSEGAFGASDLYPGVNVVAIQTPVGVQAEREVRLRSRQEELLNIGLGRPAAVYGRVLDMKGEPIEGAEVRLDGLKARTAADGVFYFPSIVSGVVLATVEKAGYARYRESVPITAGRVIEADKLEFRLAPEAKLQLVLEGAAGSTRSRASVFLFPIGQERVNSVRGQQTYPWHLVSPLEMWPGESRLIEGLPEGHVMVWVFRPGAIAEPKAAKVRLYAGRSVEQVVKLLPGPRLRGRVQRAGKPVEGVRVRFEAANRQRATENVLATWPDFRQELVFEHLPVGLQEALTDSDGRFEFTLYPEASGRVFLTAETGDGLWRAGRSVSDSESEEVLLELERASQELETLVVRLSPRFQGLPVAVRVMGAPRDPYELSPRKDALEVDELEPGTWRLDVSWHGQELLANILVQLGGGSEPSLYVKLPQEAIDGQSAEEHRRAGR